ncbi:hypothetical protein PPERSA_00783 [Pseudocohnilembus persalinus]|uniref:Uncharacterized protein n=1 Tax=Pseudocohnilembus persalinus TaxID=266149 RepID=A0A0V0Q9P9_PSEPJ|nr:hypothetical protein PPERSA_00783 [Pseudocohnilembus persalinus]|eukprot:KRW98956.1 hypothetical protein PPERSA_00783 [Pseudocohnilembus persalinus]
MEVENLENKMNPYQSQMDEFQKLIDQSKERHQKLKSELKEKSSQQETLQIELKVLQQQINDYIFKEHETKTCKITDNQEKELESQKQLIQLTEQKIKNQMKNDIGLDGQIIKLREKYKDNLQEIKRMRHQKEQENIRAIMDQPYSFKLKAEQTKLYLMSKQQEKQQLELENNQYDKLIVNMRQQIQKSKLLQQKLQSTLENQIKIE